MNKPVILAVDDDREVLGAIERDLRDHYRATYRVIATPSPREALDIVAQLKTRDVQVALFLVDQRMPEMTGTQLLVELKKLFPKARKVLLTAYADSEAAIAAINEVGLNHYLMKPWDPPEQKLYPVLDDLLFDWTRAARVPKETIRIAGSQWSPPSYAARKFLSRNQVPYEWVDIDRDQSVRALVETIAGDTSHLPVLLFPDGTSLVEPTSVDLAVKLGLQTQAKREQYDVVIVGGGPAGLASAVYASSEGLKTLLVEHSGTGGQAGTSSFIENYLGFPTGITGEDLARRAASQAIKFGTELLVGHSVVTVRREDPFRFVRMSNGVEVSCHALILAMGMEVRELPAAGIDRLTGMGVYYGAANTEAFLYRNQDVCVVGGANSAGQAALYLSTYARTVTMFVRASDLKKSMSQYLVDRISSTPNITVRTGVELASVAGENHLEYVAVCTSAGAEEMIPAAALFIFIGVAPRTDAVKGFLCLDQKGFIITGPDLRAVDRAWPLERDPYMFETSVPGVFAVGDVRAGASRRVAAAVGEGSAAIFSVHEYLRTV